MVSRKNYIQVTNVESSNQGSFREKKENVRKVVKKKETGVSLMSARSKPSQLSTGHTVSRKLIGTNSSRASLHSRRELQVHIANDDEVKVESEAHEGNSSDDETDPSTPLSQRRPQIVFFKDSEALQQYNDDVL